MESPELRRVVSQVKVPRFPGDAEGSSSSDDEQHDSRGLLQDEVLSTGYKSKKEQDLIYASLKASFEPPSAMGQRQISIERSSASEETQAGIGEELLGFSIKEESITEEAALAGKWLHRAICRRRKYALHHKRNESCTPSPVVPKPSVDDLLPKSEYTFKMQKGVFRIFANMEDEMAGRDLQDVVPIMDFCRDLRVTLRTVTSAPIKTFCHRRLHLLEAKFRVYILLNEEAERRATMQVPKRDFYNVRKVDTHVHHSSCMHQKHLLRFIRKKIRTEGEEHVLRREGQLLTLTEVFKSLSMSPDDLNLDTLDVHADRSLFHRFDKFNLKYNPFGQSRLREVFLKMDNYLEGRYLAEITKEVFNDLEENKYQQAEYRISIYGRNPHEFSKLARWVVTFDLFSPNVRWLIQVPRLAHLMLEQRSITTLEEMFDNIFRPLFAVTVDPSVDPPLHALLKTVVGFDSVDDESLPERKRLNHDFDASEWKSTESVPYSHYCYFMWANLNSLNRLRLERGLNTFTFRPHAGEAGDIDHLATAFLLADNVSHGVMLRKSPVLQYLYYVEQIGLAMSPMSNNSLFVNYTANPFAMFFKRGLNVSLSTDDPLQFHLTKEPLIEEYGLAKQMWHLSVTDMCEIASNSVKQSGFEDAIKAYWLGGDYYKQGVEGNSILRSNVPDIRVAFRQGILDKERAWLLGCAKESAACDAGAVDQGVSLRSSSSTVQQEVYPSVSAWIAAAHRTRKEAKEASFK